MAGFEPAHSPLREGRFRHCPTSACSIKEFCFVVVDCTGVEPVPTVLETAVLAVTPTTHMWGHRRVILSPFVCDPRTYIQVDVFKSFHTQLSNLNIQRIYPCIVLLKMSHSSWRLKFLSFLNFFIGNQHWPQHSYLSRISLER